MNDCKILDDDEIENVEKNKYNFRSWTVEDLEKRNFPFERFQKKEFPFLFKKKGQYQKEESKISLNEIIIKVRDLSMNSPILSYMQNDIVPSFDLDQQQQEQQEQEQEQQQEQHNLPHSPPYPPLLSVEEAMSDLKISESILKDG